MNSRLIQLIALVVAIACSAACGRLLPPILKQTREAGLRYTDVSVEGAPPFVALGTAIGALRGLIVDYLWIKVHIMKEEGLFYEVMADAELITKLQPRFAAVWAFHGHNMAYNISVACNTEEERWEWVNAGIRLVREEGLKYNPNNLVLHKELAFWFAHKIEGYSDDAHLYYKRAFTQEWHALLGQPPEEYEARIEWIGKIADAPETLEQAEQRTEGVLALVERLNNSLTPFGEAQRFEPTREFLATYSNWQAVMEQSATAQLFGVEERFRAESPFFNAFDEIAGDTDPAVQAAWDTLLAFVRKRVLVDDYNMSPKLMYEFTRDLGPIDWRHGQAHALYWSRRGSMYGEARVANDDDIYKMLNNDRLQLQAMQDLARYGRISFDPFSSELPARFPDPRWIDTIEQQFEYFYAKHYETRGAGGETFIAFLKNFMSSAVRQAYRSGETERAQRLLDELDQRFGFNPNGTRMHFEFAVPLDVFVKNEIQGEYEFQPFLAPSEAVAGLRYGFRVGIGQDRPEVYRDAKAFVAAVIEYFKGNEYNNFVNKFGRQRMAELIGRLEDTEPIAFLQLMTDPTIRLQEKMTIWAKVDKEEPELRLRVYDQMAPILQQQFARHELSRKYEFNQLFPQPPGLEQYRLRMAQERARRERELQEQRRRDEAATRSPGP
jgi:hypothetical protein